MRHDKCNLAYAMVNNKLRLVILSMVSTKQSRRIGAATDILLIDMHQLIEKMNNI